jgi:hypothetical protein
MIVTVSLPTDALILQFAIFGVWEYRVLEFSTRLISTEVEVLKTGKKRVL